MGTVSIRAAGVAIAGVALAASTLAVVTPPSAVALSPGISFTADALPTWQADGVVRALAQTQGKVIAGGEFTQLRPPAGTKGTPVATSALAILDAETGEPDDCQVPVTFDTAGFTPSVLAVAADPDGTVYVGGDFNTVGGTYISRLAAIDVVTCSVITTFRADPIDSFVRTLALHDDTLYVGGDFDSVDSQPRSRFAAVDATNGDLLPWRADADGSGLAIGVSPDGSKVAIGGSFESVNGAASRALAVVDGATGANRRLYPGLIPQRSTVKTIVSGVDRFYTGSEGSGSKIFDGRIAVDWGSLDQLWRDTCQGATQSLVEYGGTLYSASHAHNCEANGYQEGRRNFFNAQSGTTGRLLGWDPRANDGIGEGIGPRALTVAVGSRSDRPYLWAGGEFTQINGAPQQGLTRFGTTDVGAPPRPLAVAESTSEGDIQVRWLTVVDPDDSRLTYQVFRNGSKKPVWTGTADSVWWKSPQVTFVDRNVKRGKTYTYQVRATDNVHSGRLSPATRARATKRTASYARTVRSDRPTLYWPFQRTDGNSTWVQEAGATSTGTRRLDARVAGGALPSSDSPLGNDPSGSIAFDGRNDYLWNDEYVAGPQVYSVEAWFKTRTRKGGSIIGYGNGRPKTSNGQRVPSDAGSIDRVLYLTNSGRVRFGVDNGTRTVLKSGRKTNDGRWHHVVGTQGAQGLALYVDGKRVGRKKAVRQAGSYNGVWHVGGDSLVGYPDQPKTSLFKGLIDEVAVYPRALSKKKVVAHVRAAKRQRK